jgi:hypothetical protein
MIGFTLKLQTKNSVAQPLASLARTELMKLDTGNGGEFVWSPFSLSHSDKKEEDTATEISCDVRTNTIEALREAGTVFFLCLAKENRTAELERC